MNNSYTYYKDLGGYYVHKPLSNLEENINLQNEEPQVKKLISNRYNNKIFYNTGGTISARWTNRGPGVNSVDIIKIDSLLVKRLEDEKFTYVGEDIKLSEHYTLEDYDKLKKDLQEKVALQKKLKIPTLRILFTHGTDYLSYFSSWIKLLSIELGFRAVIICAQRSHDKPTCELHALLPLAIRVLNNLRKNTAVCVTYHSSKQALIHDCFEIRKTETYKKQAFWSFNQTYVSREEANYEYLQKKEYLRAKTKNILHKSPILIDSFFNSLNNSYPDGSVVLGSGIGNYTKEKSGSCVYTTRVAKGPLNEVIYVKKETNNILKDESLLSELALKYNIKKNTLINYSPEALQILIINGG